MLSPIEEIKTRLDIVKIIGSYIKLQKAGVNYRALCPFHNEKTPSFFVSPARQIWHCFGSCDEGGDIFKFIMKIEGVEFGDALRILADRAGVRLQKQDPKLRTERQRLYEICELASSFFEKQAQSITGQKAKEYLLSRGINEDSIKKWRIGYAPDTWQGLSDFLVGKGYKREEIIMAGLAIKSQKEKVDVSRTYDRFRGRIMFPIFDLSSQVIGFGGRVFGDKKEIAKYVNSPATPLYDKSRVLYGLDKARVNIRKKAQCILVEGYTDVILVSQNGFENVVASSGTALTSDQLNILKRYSDNLLTAFDMDIAGDSATKRGIDLAQAQGFNIKVITMPGKKDPAEIIVEDLESWKKSVAKAKSIVDFYFETTFNKWDSKTPEGKREISKIILPVIKRVSNKIEQFHWIQLLARRLEVGEKEVLEELKKCSLPDSFIVPMEIRAKESLSVLLPKTRKEKIEENIVSLILKNLKKISLINEENFPLFSDKYKAILRNLKTSISHGEENIDILINQIQKSISVESHFLDYLFLKGEMLEVIEPELEIQTCLNELNSFEIRQKLDIISKSIKKAETEKNLGKVDSLMKEFNDLSQRIGNI